MYIKSTRINSIFMAIICCISLCFAELCMAEDPSSDSDPESRSNRSWLSIPFQKTREAQIIWTTVGIEGGIFLMDWQANKRAKYSNVDRVALVKYNHKIPVGKVVQLESSILKEMNLPRRGYFTRAGCKVGLIALIALGAEYGLLKWGDYGNEGNVQNYLADAVDSAEKNEQKVDELAEFIQKKREFKDLSEVSQNMIMFNAVAEYKRLTILLKRMSVSINFEDIEKGGENRRFVNIDEGLQLLSIAGAGFYDIDGEKILRDYIESFQSIVGDVYLKLNEIQEKLEKRQKDKKTSAEEGHNVITVNINQIIDDIKKSNNDKIISELLKKFKEYGAEQDSNEVDNQQKLKDEKEAVLKYLGYDERTQQNNSNKQKMLEALGAIEVIEKDVDAGINSISESLFENLEKYLKIKGVLKEIQEDTVLNSTKVRVYDDSFFKVTNPENIETYKKVVEVDGSKKCTIINIDLIKKEIEKEYYKQLGFMLIDWGKIVLTEDGDKDKNKKAFEGMINEWEKKDFILPDDEELGGDVDSSDDDVEFDEEEDESELDNDYDYDFT